MTNGVIRRSSMVMTTDRPLTSLLIVRPGHPSGFRTNASSCIESSLLPAAPERATLQQGPTYSASSALKSPRRLSRYSALPFVIIVLIIVSFVVPIIRTVIVRMIAKSQLE